MNRAENTDEIYIIRESGFCSEEMNVDPTIKPLTEVCEDKKKKPAIKPL